MDCDTPQPTTTPPTWKERQRALVDVPVTSQRAASAGKPKVIIITGPTAVGKTATALHVAHQVHGEIISADSVQVYKGLDVGSDKVRGD